MRLVPLAVILSSLALPARVGAADSVLLASRRGGSIEAINLDTLETVSRIRVPGMPERIAFDASGRRLLVTAPRGHEQGCCALFAMDPQSLQLSHLIEPAQSATVTADRLFTQRGNAGIEVFDLPNLNRLPTIKAPGIYRLPASPDGRRLFGLASWPRPSLDLFDAVQGVMMGSQPLPEASSLAGTWLGQQYFLFALQAGEAMLQPVSSDTGKPGQSIPLSPSASFPICKQAPYDVIASGSRLAIYGQFGLKSDGTCPVQGDFVIADPNTGAMTERFASGMNFRQMLASPDGRYLYGLDVGSPAWGRVRIVKLEAGDGRVVAEKSIDPDVWYLTMGEIPHQREGRLDLGAILPR